MGGAIAFAFVVYTAWCFFKIYKREFGENSTRESVDDAKGFTEAGKTMLTYAEQEELKARIRGRMNSAPDPKRMPQQPIGSATPMEVQAYHDVLDDCHTEGCDVSPSSAPTTISPLEEEKKRARLRKRNAVVQMMLADSVLRRRDFY